MPRDLYLVKLGGSLITDKSNAEQPRQAELERVVEELASVLAQPDRPDVVLAHGSGSFGHVAATGTPLADRDRSDLGAAVEEVRAASVATQKAAGRLHGLVMATLDAAGVAAFSVPPSSFVWFGEGAVKVGSARPVLLALDLGLLPVTYGDVVLDERRGAAICSTEPLLVNLAVALEALGRRARGVVWLGATDGLFDESGSTIPAVDETNLEHALRVAGGSAGVDVTGGMALRVRAAWQLAERGVPSWIVDGSRSGALTAALQGRPTGTEVRLRG